MYYITTDRKRWKEKKSAASVTSKRLSDMGFKKRSIRMSACSSVLASRYCGECNIRYITKLQLCRDRLCSICQWRRGLALKRRLKKILSDKENNVSLPRYVFMTLTARNCEWEKLGEDIKNIMGAWGRLSRRKKFREAFTGWCRVMEVTLGKDGKAHTHLHILIQTKAGENYFSADNPSYISQAELAELWRKALKADYLPVVDVRAVRSGGCGRAAGYITKYITKSADISGLSDNEYRHYVNGIHGARLWTVGGSWAGKIKDDEIDNNLHSDVEASATASPDEECNCPLCGAAMELMIERWTNGDYIIVAGAWAEKVKDGG